MDIDCRACNYRGNLKKCAERINTFAEECHSSSIVRRNKDLDDEARRVREEIIKRDYDILKALGDDGLTPQQTELLTKKIERRKQNHNR